MVALLTPIAFLHNLLLVLELGKQSSWARWWWRCSHPSPSFIIFSLFLERGKQSSWARWWWRCSHPSPSSPSITRSDDILDGLLLFYSCKSLCSGSITFWCWSGSADPSLWLMDPDSSIFVIDLQTKNKFLTKRVSAYYFLEVHFSKIKSQKEVTKQ